MNRVKAANSVAFANRDIAPVSGTPQYFTAGNPVGPVPPTVLPGYFMNMVQDEFLAVITAAGLTPDDTNWAQLLAAIKKLDAHLAPATARSATGVSLTAGYSGSATVSLTAPAAGSIFATGGLNTSGTGSTGIQGNLQYNGSTICGDQTTTSQSQAFIQPIAAGATATIAYVVSAAANTGTLGTYFVTALFVPNP